MKFNYWMLHFAFVVFCILGFVYQITKVLSLYFMYPTATTTTVRMPDKLEVPAVSLCIRLGDVIKGDDGLWAYQMNETTRMEHLKKLQRTMTLKEILERTPPATDLILECMHRHPFSYELIETNTTACRKLFSITKYFIQEFICYRFLPSEHISQEKFSYQQIAFSLRYPGLFYGLVLNPDSIGGANFLKVVVHRNTGFPHDSIAFSPTFYRVAHEEPKYNNVKIVYTYLTTHLLPPPYQTDCREYLAVGGGRKPCINNCIQHHVKNFTGKYFFGKVSDIPLAEQILSEIDLRNETFENILNNIEDDCIDNTCRQQSCYDRHYLTIVQKEERSETDHFTLEVNAPDVALTDVRHRAILGSSELFVYISSCITTWFNVSFLSLSPRTVHTVFKTLLNRGKKPDCKYCLPVKKYLQQEISLLRTRVLTRKLLYRENW